MPPVTRSTMLSVPDADRNGGVTGRDGEARRDLPDLPDRQDRQVGRDRRGAHVEVRALSWTPLGRRTPVLPDLDLTVSSGERVLVAGPSGSGKSTLLRALAGVLDLVEPGRLHGTVAIDGRPPREVAERVGLLVQDPADARVAGHVGRDVAFGPENLALPRAVIQERVRWSLDAVGFPYGVDHRTDALSGGEAQRLALAGVIAVQPGLLLLDEPTSMLDEGSAATVRAAVVRSVETVGATLVVVEHRLDGWAEVCDRLIVLDADGSLIADGPIRHVLADRASDLLAAGIWVPGRPDPDPWEVPRGLVGPARAVDATPHGARGTSTPVAQEVGSGELLLSAEAVRLVRVPRRGLRLSRADEPPVAAVDGVDLDLAAGTFTVVRGRSGAGKSSLIGLLCGLQRPTTGTVSALPVLARGAGPTPYRWRPSQLAARVGWVPQQAELSLAGNTVATSLLATARALGQEPDAAEARARDLCDLLGLTPMAGRNPYQLSGGELRRLAVATGLLHGPDVLALDEPTVGQDRLTWAAVTGLVRAARAAGTAVLAATHDDRLAQYADRVRTLDRGRVVG